MSYDKNTRITGEYDPPLSVRNPNLTEADIKRLEEIEEKYRKMKAERSSE